MEGWGREGGQRGEMLSKHVSMTALQGIFSDHVRMLYVYVLLNLRLWWTFFTPWPS